MEKLLEDGDYTRARKRSSSLRGAVSVIYWLTATAVFLFYTFGPRGNGQPQYSWFIWAIAMMRPASSTPPSWPSCGSWRAGSAEETSLRHRTAASPILGNTGETAPAAPAEAILAIR